MLRNVSPSYEILLKSSWEIETNLRERGTHTKVRLVRSTFPLSDAKVACGLIRSAPGLFSFVNSFEKLLGQTKLLLYIFCQTRNVFCFETMLKEY